MSTVQTPESALPIAKLTGSSLNSCLCHKLPSSQRLQWIPLFLVVLSTPPKITHVSPMLNISTNELTRVLIIRSFLLHTNFLDTSHGSQPACVHDLSLFNPCYRPILAPHQLSPLLDHQRALKITDRSFSIYATLSLETTS